MKRTVVPGKRDYFVVIGADRSASTRDFGRATKISRAVYAQCELLARVGVKFAGYGHSGEDKPMAKYPRGADEDMHYLYVMPFKGPNDPWNDESRTKLVNQMPIGFNLDGHQLEYYRKVAEESTATDKVIVYYTDGEMPYANYHEEKEILLREQAICERLGIQILMVGVNTDSPKKFGFNTVRMDSDADIIKVIAQLATQLAK